LAEAHETLDLVDHVLRALTVHILIIVALQDAIDALLFIFTLLDLSKVAVGFLGFPLKLLWSTLRL